MGINKNPSIHNEAPLLNLSAPSNAFLNTLSGNISLFFTRKVLKSPQASLSIAEPIIISPKPTKHNIIMGRNNQAGPGIKGAMIGRTPLKTIAKGIIEPPTLMTIKPINLIILAANHLERNLLRSGLFSWRFILVISFIAIHIKIN